jgi:hypothetical protein
MLASCDVWHRSTRVYDPTVGLFVPSYEDIDPKPLLQDATYLAGMGNSFTARDRGSVVDRFCKECAEGLVCKFKELDDWLEQVLQEGKPNDGSTEPYAWACGHIEVLPHLISAWEFFAVENVEIAVTNQWVFSTLLGCGGEADGIGNFNERGAVMDFKTSSGPSRRDAIQISVYRACLKAPLDAILIYFTKDGYRVVSVDERRQKECLSEWRRLRKCYDFKHSGRTNVPWTNIKTGG